MKLTDIPDDHVGDYHLRLTSSFDKFEILKPTLEMYGVYGAREHEPKNHYHLIIYNIAKDDVKALQEAIGSAGYKGNKEWSLAFARDTPELELYISKGASPDSPPDIVINSVTGNDPKILHKLQWEKYPEKKKDKPTRKTIDKKEAFLEACKDLTVEEIIPQTIFAKIMDVSKKNKWLPPDDFRMVSYIEYIAQQLSIGRSHLEFVKLKRILRKMADPDDWTDRFQSQTQIQSQKFFSKPKSRNTQ